MELGLDLGKGVETALSDDLRPSEKDMAVRFNPPLPHFSECETRLWVRRKSAVNHMAHNFSRLFLPQRKLRLVAQPHGKRAASESADGNHLQRHSAGKAQIGKAARNQRVEFAESRIGDNRVDVRNRAFTEF